MKHMFIKAYLDAMLQAVQLPAGIAYLDTSLTNMDGDDFTLRREKRGARGEGGYFIIL